MAVMFDQVDIVLAATNPSTAFGAEGHLPGTFEGRESNPGNNGALTAPRTSTATRPSHAGRPCQ